MTHLTAQDLAGEASTTSKPAGNATMARARAPVRLAEAVRAIPALGGGAVRHSSILAVCGRVDVMALPVGVVPVFDERGFVGSLVVVVVAWRPGE